jgi:sulfoxide reductase catalytic subunit YedY
MEKIPASEITPEEMYFSRREFMKVGVIASGMFLLAGCSPGTLTLDDIEDNGTSAPRIEEQAALDHLKDELDDPVNSFHDITNYNNYYEFTPVKEDVADLAKDFKVRPWTIDVTGLVDQPTIFDIDEIIKKFPSEERIYRLRCVEGWSMVIPWLGFPMAKLLKEVRPQMDAKFVKLTTFNDPSRMPTQDDSWFNWPYIEGLRLDEAMHDLTLLVTGLYGKELPTQNGAPLRLAIPWKYGFKSIKAIVRIELVSEMPITFWMNEAPNEYGFYANVNPEVPHPRWSQASERRIGELSRRKTLPFNGYAEEVASLYQDMDLKVNF